MKINTFGVEIEKPVSHIKTGNPYLVSQQFFKTLKNMAEKRKVKTNFHFSDISTKTILGTVSGDIGEQGLDNGFNLLETAINYQKSLTHLNKLILIDLQTTKKALTKEDATLINFSVHPLGKTDIKTYRKSVAPKGIYSYVLYRGWDHTAGIDGKAQNSPTTGVEVKDAAEAVSVIIGSGAAFVALFANSPFEEGRLSKYKESRLKIWDRMMKQAKVEGDKITATFPEKPFKNLAQYFNWMFGGKTGIHFVLSDNEEKTNYKGIGKKILIINNNPSVLTYLSKNEWQARFLSDLKTRKDKFITIIPNISHMEAMQFAQFSGARIRYALNHKDFPLQDFVEACKKTNQKKVEKILQRFIKFIYIEGRDSGTNFVDKEIYAAGKEIAKSVTISPSAIQSGLINNLHKVSRYLQKYSWQTLGKLRESAIKDGLEGASGNLSVKDFTKDILNLAEEGLDKKERWMLSYPKWVLSTKQNGADRAINFIKNHRKGEQNAIVELIKQREVIIS